MARPRKVSAGRMVVYTARATEKSAVISHVYDNGDVALTVYDHTVSTGTYAVARVPQSDWRWPESK